MAAMLKTFKREISVTVWPILMKFDTVMHIGPQVMHGVGLTPGHSTAG